MGQDSSQTNGTECKEIRSQQSKQMNDSDIKEPSSSHNYYKPEVTDFFKYWYFYLI